MVGKWELRGWECEKPMLLHICNLQTSVIRADCKSALTVINSALACNNVKEAVTKNVTASFTFTPCYNKEYPVRYS